MKTPSQEPPTQEPLLLYQILLNPGERWESSAEEFILILAQQGRSRIQFGDTAAILRAGDVMVLNGREPVTVTSAQKVRFQFNTFSVSLSHLALLFNTTDLSLRERFERECHEYKFCAARSRVARQCHKLIEEVPLLPKVQQRTQLLRVAAEALAEPFENDVALVSGMADAQETFAQKLSELSGELLLRLSANQAAQRFACSRRHLNRLFHRHFGASFAGVRLELRLLKALALLRNTESKVIWVAHQSGFNHLRLFNQHFKRRFGHTPSQWRKLNVSSQKGLNLGRHLNNRGSQGIPFPALMPSAPGLQMGRLASDFNTGPAGVSFSPVQAAAAPLDPALATPRSCPQSQTGKTLCR
ncbi:MAG TPA: helix-turn-helix transcriptional regulator [Verrucomicrobiae bacterium]|nr:helix-turn-helix transcriptional regulator [Verrucomicrobiae bacterium]